jgi:hypothetical protein
MGKPHMIAALVIVLSTSLLVSSPEPGRGLQSIAPQAGGSQKGGPTEDPDAPLLIRKN